MSEHEERAGRGVARLAIRGAAALGLRQLMIAIVTAVGGALLARSLTPQEFGVYGIAGVLLSFLLVFGDAGLGASLVRQLEEVTEHELRQVFTVQLGLTLALGGTVMAYAGQLTKLFELREGDRIVFVLAAAAVVVQAFQVVPVILLERRLDFARLGLLSVTEVMAFYVCSIALAATGTGARSVGVGLLLQASVGVVLAWSSCPWRIGLTLRLSGMWARLRYSLLYQGSNVLSMAKDGLTPLLVALVSGAAAIGYVSWAEGLAAFVLLTIAPLSRLYIPVFARLQDDRERLSRAVQVSMRVTYALTAPISVLVLVLSGPLTDIIYGPQWRPGLVVFQLLWLANLVVPAAQPLFALLNAVGAASTTFRLSLMWMVATWLLTPPLLFWLGLRGFGAANALVQLSNVVLLRRARQHVEIRPLEAFLPAWTASAAAGAAVLCLRAVLPPLDIGLLLVCLVAGGAVYLAVSWPLQQQQLRYAWTLLRVP